MISYTIELIFFWIFGPLFLLITILPIWDKEKFQKRFQARCEALMSFYDSAGFFAMSIGVAAIIRDHQGATYFELSFLQSLLNMQALSFLAVTFSVAGVVIPGSCLMVKHSKAWYRRTPPSSTEETRAVAENLSK